MLKKSLFNFSHNQSIDNLHTTITGNPEEKAERTDSFFPAGDFEDDELTLKRWRGRLVFETFDPLKGFSLFAIVEFIWFLDSLIGTKDWYQYRNVLGKKSLREKICGKLLMVGAPLPTETSFKYGRRFSLGQRLLFFDATARRFEFT